MKEELEKLLQDKSIAGWQGKMNPSGVLTAAEEIKYLDTQSLVILEKAFRRWAEDASRADVRASRRRVLLIFLLIRYTGARLGEILAIDETEHIDIGRLAVKLGSEEDSSGREVEIPAELAVELAEIFRDPDSNIIRGGFFHLDAAHVRKKFYERAEACGFARELGNPSAIRRSRAIELLRNNIPLPIVQKILGHSTSSLTSAYVDFSSGDMKQVMRHYVDRESKRKTSARNSFFGKITGINKGDIQSIVEITTFTGNRVTSVITNESLERIVLKEGSLASAEIKAPWVIVSKRTDDSDTSASNSFRGIISRIITGSITTEYVITLPDGTDMCAIVTEESRKSLGLKEGMEAQVMFSSFAVVLNTES